MTIPTDPKVIKQQQEQAERNIERGDWPDDFGLPDILVPKSPPAPVDTVLRTIGERPLPKK